MLLPIFRCMRFAAEHSLEEFVAEYPHPYLLVEPFLELEDTGFNTDELSVAKGGTTPLLAPVAKAEGKNPFSAMVTIGRAGRNDITLRADGISKFHAYLMVDIEGTVSLTDAGSSFGTFVDGEQLPVRTKRDLRPGQTVSFGGVNAAFYTPPLLYERMRAEAGGASGS
jgi:FHA domain